MTSVKVSSPVMDSATTANLQSKNPPRRVAITTMGCKVNIFESELIMQKLAAKNYLPTADITAADVYLINTCTVTAESDRQARQQVRKAIRANPDAWVVMTGCYAQVAPDACAAIAGVDLVVGNSRKLDIPQLLAPLYANALPPVLVDDVKQQISLPDQLVNGFDGRTRAFVQIQQGCDQGCTFCIIHTARGASRSFAPTAIKRQVERLVMNGYREIVICGVDIGAYGSDFKHAAAENQFDLAALLRQLVQLPGDFRLRLSSVDPAHISDQLISIIASSDKICPQLHLSMQSGNTLILKRMKRRATREILYERLLSLRAAVPELVLSADILVGFPTETEQHFADTVQAVRDLNISFPHVFAYSRRAGTPAARIPQQVATATRKLRAATIRRVGKEVWNQVATSMVGSQQTVLIENQSKAASSAPLTGRAANYFMVTIAPSDWHPDCVADGWQQVKITGVSDNALIARRLV